VAADFGGEWKHAAEDFAKWSAIVLRDPVGELEEFGGEECGVVEEALDFFYFDVRCGWVVVQGDDDAEESLAGERDEDACPDFRSEVAERVGEGAVERDRQRDVGVEGHKLRVPCRVVSSADECCELKPQRRDLSRLLDMVQSVSVTARTHIFRSSLSKRTDVQSQAIPANHGVQAS
jgi:hypothetical protein